MLFHSVNPFLTLSNFVRDVTLILEIKIKYNSLMKPFLEGITLNAIARKNESQVRSRKVFKEIHPSAIYVYSFFFLFWLILVFVATQGLSLVAMRQGYLLSWCLGFSLRWLLLLQRTGSRHAGFMSFGAWTQLLWHRSLAALWHVGSSQTRDQTHVPCIDRQILFFFF